MDMKRLFAVADSRNRTITLPDGSPAYFENKMYAKGCREAHPGTHVTLGPDHYRHVSQQGK